jgi:hypothetical protein
LNLTVLRLKSYPEANISAPQGGVLRAAHFDRDYPSSVLGPNTDNRNGEGEGHPRPNLEAIGADAQASRP